jgi:hypothetical protein
MFGIVGLSTVWLITYGRCFSNLIAPNLLRFNSQSNEWEYSPEATSSEMKPLVGLFGDGAHWRKVWEQLDEAWGKRARTDIPSRHPIFLQNEQPPSYEVTFDTKNKKYQLREEITSKCWVLGRKDIRRKIEVHIIDQGKDGEAAIVVHDNGPGMSPEELKGM